MLSAIDHVGVAVESINDALAFYRDQLGMPLVHRETVTEQGVDAALLDVGDSHIELLQPLGPDTAVGKFLSRRGPGLHHVAYRVASVAGDAGRLRRRGHAPDRRGAADRDPRLAGRLPSPRLHRRGAHRDRAATQRRH